MAQDQSNAAELQACFGRWRAGDPAARDPLFRHVLVRFERLARKMLRGFPRVRRWEQTDDVLQNAVIRLLRALEAVRPASLPEFFALTAEQIRRELLDLARHYYGPRGPGTHHDSVGGLPADNGRLPEPADQSLEPSALALWTEFHARVRALPAAERQAIELLFYQELPQADAAALAGVHVRTLQRHWQAALLKLHSILEDDEGPRSVP